MTGSDTPEPTLGERLDAAARVIAARHQVSYPWADTLIPILRRAGQLSVSPGDRFERHETPAGEPIPARPPASRPFPPMPALAGEHALGLAPVAAPAPAWSRPTPEDPVSELPPDTRAALTDIAGPGAGLLRVRTGAAADSLSRAHRADAVTTGADVWFRSGRFRPREPAGFALLAHEAAHVTALLNPRQSAPGGAAGEEDGPLAAEQAALRRFGPPAAAVTAPGPGLGRPAERPPAPASPAGPAYPAGPAGLAAASAAPVAPRPASVDRAISQPPPFDVEELRRSLITDLMRRLRSDFERGG